MGTLCRFYYKRRFTDNTKDCLVVSLYFRSDYSSNLNFINIQKKSKNIDVNLLVEYQP